MAGIGGVVVQFRADADKAIRETRKFVRSLDDVDGTAKKARKGLSTMAKVGIAGVATGAAGAAVALFDMAKGAAEDASAAAKLARNLKNATKATDDQVASLEDWISKQGLLLGVTDDKLRPALSRLVQSTKDIGDAQSLASLAMDIAAGSGKDLQTVAEALARANDGQTTGLRRLGVSLGDNVKNYALYIKAQQKMEKAQQGVVLALEEFGPASKEYKKAQDKVADVQAEINQLNKEGIDWQGELGKAYEGAAETQTKTAQGALDKLTLIWGEMQETLGASLIDPITEFSEFLASPQGQTWLEDLMTDVEGVAEGMGELARNSAEFVAELQKIKDWYDSWPEWLKANPGKGPNWNDPIKKAQEWKRDETFNRVVSGPDEGRPSGKTSRPTPTVNVTVNNGKQESIEDSAALAIRIARKAGLANVR